LFYYFFISRTCNFFQWADEVGPPRGPGGGGGGGTSFKNSSSSFPSTSSATMSTASSYSNKKPVVASVEGDGPLCKCGEPSTTRTTQKEGPNKGRQFFCCKKSDGYERKISHYSCFHSSFCNIFFSCGFVGWVDENGTGGNNSSFSSAKKYSGNTNNAVGGGGGNMTCSHCKQQGHWARSCQNK
jgi:DNA topoisomerase-3